MFYNNVNNHSLRPSYNIVRNWEENQGITNAADLSYQIIRDYNIRHISVQNSSPKRAIGIAITPYSEGPLPPILYVMMPGEIKHLGINSQGGPVQFLWLIDAETKLPIGSTVPLRRDVNEFVIRDGLNKAFVQFFKSPSYSAAK